MYSNGFLFMHYWKSIAVAFFCISVQPKNVSNCHSSFFFLIFLLVAVCRWTSKSFHVISISCCCWQVSLLLESLNCIHWQTNVFTPWNLLSEHGIPCALVILNLALQPLKTLYLYYYNGEWWVTMRKTHPWIHMTLWLCGL